MDIAKKGDGDGDEKNRKSYRKRDKKRDIIVRGTCTNIFLSNSSLKLLNSRVQTNR
jgi:hypothetical protein